MGRFFTLATDRPEMVCLSQRDRTVLDSRRRKTGLENPETMFKYIEIKIQTILRMTRSGSPPLRSSTVRASNLSRRRILIQCAGTTIPSIDIIGRKWSLVARKRRKSTRITEPVVYQCFGEFLPQLAPTYLHAVYGSYPMLSCGESSKYIAQNSPDPHRLDDNRKRLGNLTGQKRCLLRHPAQAERDLTFHRSNTADHQDLVLL